jgi:hypothetical protein
VRAGDFGGSAICFRGLPVPPGPLRVSVLLEQLGRPLMPRRRALVPTLGVLLRLLGVLLRLLGVDSRVDRLLRRRPTLQRPRSELPQPPPQLIDALIDLGARCRSSALRSLSLPGSLFSC